MTAIESKSLAGIGFLAIVEQSDGDLLGGLLVVNHQLRPLEFHCTAPVRANRAQQILYGPTLTPYLYGEQIGPALAASATTTMSLVFVDSAAMEALAGQISVPVALFDPPLEQGGCAIIAAADAAPAGWHAIDVSGRRVLVVSRQDDAQRVANEVAQFDPAIDLSEPFERIRQAIDEAQRSAA